MIALLAMLAAAAPGGITYLDCTTQQESGQKEWRLAMNEAQGAVDVVTTAGYGQANGRHEATFTPDTVEFMGFTLSRTNLTMSRHMALGAVDLGEETGQCRVVAPPNRAF